MNQDLFVGNLPFSTTEEELTALFSDHGEVESVRIARDRRSGRPRGHAFVRMKDVDDAFTAIHDLDGMELGGRPLQMRLKLPRGQRPAPKALS